MTRRGWLRLTFAGVGVIALAALIDPLPRLIWNATASVPTGLYALRPAVDPEIGELVAVAPPRPLADFLAAGGYLPDGVPLLKHVAALPGQKVCRFGLAVAIEGRQVALARPRDRRGRILPTWTGCRVIGPEEVFLMNANAPDSLDGRYFGPLPSNSVLGRATPLWTDPPRPTRAPAG